MEIKIDDGVIRINRVDVIVDHPEFKVVDIDAHTKYWSVLGRESDGSSISLVLHTNEYTIKANMDKKDMPTKVTFLFADDEGDDWHVISTVSARYSLEVALYRVPPPGNTPT